MLSGKGRQDSICHSYQVSLTLKHILIEGPAFDQERRATSLHGRSMSEIIDCDCHTNNLFVFTK